MDGENTILLPIRDYGGRRFVCYDGYAYALIRAGGEGGAMLPVVRNGQAVCVVRDAGPEFGEQFRVLHVFRTPKRWAASFVQLSWLYERELDNPVGETNRAVADYYDSDAVSLSGVGF
jgi:hypothetical protein